MTGRPVFVLPMTTTFAFGLLANSIVALDTLPRRTKAHLALFESGALPRLGTYWGHTICSM
jgi:hypothetical protein